MSIYLLEVFENSTIDIPDFGLAFNSIDTLIEFVEKKTKKLTPDTIEFAKELKDSGVGFFLDNEETIRVTIIPLVTSASETKYDNLFTINHKDGKKTDHKEKTDNKENTDKENTDEENKDAENKDTNNNDEEATVIKNSHEIIEVEDGLENSISNAPLVSGDTIVDFHDLMKSHSDPKLYIRKETFDRLPKLKKKVKDPYTQVPINVATTYKIKVKNSKHTTKKNNSKTNKGNAHELSINKHLVTND